MGFAGFPPFDLPGELSRFRGYAGATTAAGRVEVLAPDILRFVPSRSDVGFMKVGFLALVHGNEVVGLPILNSLLGDLLSGRQTTRHEVYFGLGNLPAALADRRFLEKDLNRCFGQTATDTPEARRARELEVHLLDQVDYLIDLHQTVHPSRHPFFIFQYSSSDCFRHLALMNRELTTILQFDAIGEGQNLSTDEYLRSRGRFGVALELGQKGWSKDLFQMGLDLCGNFLTTLEAFSDFTEVAFAPARPLRANFFEISDRFAAPDDDSALDAHWVNFARFEADQVIGRIGGRSSFVADRAGFMLFPKPGQSVDAGTTLFHICQPLGPEKLRALMAPEAAHEAASSLCSARRALGPPEGSSSVR